MPPLSGSWHFIHLVQDCAQRFARSRNAPQRMGSVYYLPVASSIESGPFDGSAVFSAIPRRSYFVPSSDMIRFRNRIREPQIRPPLDFVCINLYVNSFLIAFSHFAYARSNDIPNAP
jgi:hypothetical protein